MLNYKVEVEQKTQRIIIRWFDEQGNECEPESGTYEVTIPKDTFIWYGDNLSCEGKQGNDEYKYTFVVAEKPPIPNVVPIMKNGIIHYIVANSAVEDNYNKLGYITNAEVSESPFKVSYEVGDYGALFVSNADVSSFGFDENKCEYQVSLDEDYDFVPNREYTITLKPNNVYNQGLGEEYNDSKSYNDAIPFKFKGTPQPSLSVSTYSVKDNVFTIEFAIENFHTEMADGYYSELEPSRRPYLISGNRNDNAYPKEPKIVGNFVSMDFYCKDATNFIVANADGTKAYKFDLFMYEDFALNFGDKESLMGVQGNQSSRQTLSIPIIGDVPIPQVIAETRDSDSLTTKWSDIYLQGLTTQQQSTPKMYANMSNGTKVDISSHINVTMPSNKKNELYIDFDSETNFGLNPKEVYNYVLEYPMGMMKNVGDEKIYKGEKSSVKYEYSYFPITSVPQLSCIATNVNPFYPIVSGSNITLNNGGVKTTILADALTITDKDNKIVLMGWNSDSGFTNTDVNTCIIEQRLLQPKDTYEVRTYEQEDKDNYDAPLYFMEGNRYEENHDGVINININGAKIFNDGNGISTLGKLYATADTISIKKYPLEVALRGLRQYGDDTITMNTMGGFVDWKDTPYMQQLMGEEGWGKTFSTNDVLNDGTPQRYLSGYTMYAVFDGYWQYELAKKFKSVFGESFLASAKERVENIECRGKDYFDEWFNQIFIKDNPIKYTGSTEQDFASYTDYVSTMTSERKEEVLFMFYDFCDHKRIRQMFSIYNIRTTSEYTYTFLFDQQVEHLKMGSFYSPYNSGGENYAPAITRLLKLDTSKQKDFKYFLYNQNSLYDWSAYTDFDGAEDITGMFYQSGYDFIQSLEGKYFNGYINTKSTMNDVVVASSAFCGNCVAEKYPNQFSFSNLKVADYMFYDNRNLWQIPTSFNPTKLENADRMFATTSEQTDGDCKHYDLNGNYLTTEGNSFPYYDTIQKKCVLTANANTIECINSYNINITAIPSSWESVNNIETANFMFSNRHSLKSVPMQWNFRSLVQGEGLFNECNALEKIPTAWTETSELRTANLMFFDCSSLTSVHEGFECNNIENARRMFEGCTSLQSLNRDFNPKSLLHAQSMFAKCAKLKTIPIGWDSIKQLEESNFMFSNCTSLVEIPTRWTECDSSDISSMFYDCDSLTECNIVFNKPKYCNEIYDSCDNLVKVAKIDLGECVETSIKPYNKSPKLFDFKLANFGRVENHTAVDTSKKDDVILKMENVLNIKGASEEETNALVNSWVFLLDNLWTGETIGNETSIDSRKHDTHNRNAKTQNCYIKFYGLSNELLTKIRQNVTKQVAKDVLDTYMKGAERKWDYILTDKNV